MNTLRNVSLLATQARRMATVFDMDGTLVRNTGRVFMESLMVDGLGVRHWRATLQGPLKPHLLLLGAWGFVPRVGSHRPLLQRLESLSHDPHIAALLQDFSQRYYVEHFFPGTVNELAWRRANLQTTVLITGAVAAIDHHFLARLQTDHTFHNEHFWPVTVTGRRKPKLLQSLFGERGLVPHTVFTDSYADRHMILSFPWRRVYLVEPDRRLRELGQQRGWQAVNRNDRFSSPPPAVQAYASEVIRGQGNYTVLRDNFYRRLLVKVKLHQGLLDQFLQGGLVEDPVTLQDLMAGFGLYLTEPESVRREFCELVGPQFDATAFAAYQGLVAMDHDAIFPLTVLQS